MHSYRYLLDIALILLATKGCGLLTRRVQLPQVVGALVAGIILGPAFLGIVLETEFIDEIAEIGVIVLMFCAGLETDISELKKCGKASFVIALFGVLIPLVGGFVLAHFFTEGPIDQMHFLQNMFVGVILTATSVSISVETLKEMGKLSTPSGNAILGAALIDDILGVIALTVITSLAGPGVSMVQVFTKIIAFFALAILVGVIARKIIVKWFSKTQDVRRRFSIVSFAFALIFAFIAEHYFGVADITGAFIAGLIISGTTKAHYVASRIETLSYLLISPVFFASIGLKFHLPEELSANIIIFTLLLVLVAILTKIIGCGIGARLCKYTKEQSLRIGVGMVSRGEVALIVATKGMAVGLMKDVFFAPILFMVVVTTVITPILLKFAFKHRISDPDVLINTDIVDNYNGIEKYEVEAQKILAEMDHMKES